VLDSKRANNRYIKLLEEFKMDQKVSSLKSWLISIKWKTVKEKIIRNTHYIGKFENYKTKEEVFKLRNHIVSVLENWNLETIKYKYPSEIDKLVSYLKWNQEKYRVNKVRLK
jgi:hypothetical protein